jgi:segregation and condensation protein B
MPGPLPAATIERVTVASASPLARDPALARLEAILFLAREPLASRKLGQYANLADGTQARTLVRRLNELYDAVGRAFRVEQVAGGYQLLTRRKLAPWLRRLAHVPPETRLSAPALETLAVIAYRQPVPRADIEAIRGVNCGEILRQLMERDLARIGGRSDELGRPYLYSTTKRFLQVFGLVHLEQMPRRDELRASPLPAAPPMIPQASAEADSSAPTTTDDEPLNDFKSESNER